MESYKIIDVYSSFLCNDSFQQAGAGVIERNEDNFFTGYAAAEKYLSLDFDCPLNRLAVIPTGVKERLVKKNGRKKIIMMKYRE
jgi:hypothetical protein